MRISLFIFGRISYNLIVFQKKFRRWYIVKRKTTVLSLLIVGSLLFSANVSAEDISTHWSYENFMYAKDKGFIQGDQHGNLNPDKAITRAEFATTIVKAMKLQLPVTTVEEHTTKPFKSFNDVAVNDWFYNEVSIATYYDLIKGDEFGNFKPSDLISREEMAVILYRAVQHLQYDSIKFTLNFSDNAKISNWAVEEIQHILSNGLMTGLPDGSFGPQLTASRAEAVTVLRRLLEIDPENPIKAGSTELTIEYPTSFEAALNKQVAANPKADGSGLFIASKEAVEYYMHPGSFDSLHPYYYQFLKLSEVVNGITAEEINTSFLKDAGILAGTAASFIEAGANLNVNFIYLLSHAVHETGYGKSQLAMGIEVGRNEIGNAEQVTDENREKLTDIRVVYNMYGVGAKDTAPNKLGSEYAYNQGWFTVHDAIVGGASFVASNYFKRGQDTLYKMKWNPSFPGNLQYATHVIWAVKQAEKIADIYKKTGADKKTNAVFEIPYYVDQPAPPKVEPTMEAWYAVDTTNAGKTGVINASDVNLRSYPGTGAIIGKLGVDATITVIGENNNWYKVTVDNGLSGWVSGEYIKWDSSDDEIIGKTGYVNVDDLKLRKIPVDGEILTLLKRDTPLTILEVNNGWYKVNANGVDGWISSEYVQWDPSNDEIVGKTGYVNVDDLRLRNAPIDGEVLTLLKRDTPLSILEVNNDWYKVNANAVEGWISGEYVEWNSSDDEIVGKTGYVNTDDLRLRNAPVDGEVLTLLKRDTPLTILEENNEWYKVNANGVEGWVSGSFVRFE